MNSINRFLAAGTLTCRQCLQIVMRSDNPGESHLLGLATDKKAADCAVRLYSWYMQIL